MEAEKRFTYLCQYESREDQVKVIGAERELLKDRQFWLLPDSVRTIHCLNVPSTGKPVYIYHFLYWELLEPILKREEIRYQILDVLPKDAGQSNPR